MLSRGLQGEPCGDLVANYRRILQLANFTLFGHDTIRMLNGDGGG